MEGFSRAHHRLCRVEEFFLFSVPAFSVILCLATNQLSDPFQIVPFVDGTMSEDCYDERNV